MDYLNLTIKSLVKKEIINYKVYANSTHLDTQRKDILLFDLLKKHPDVDVNDDKIIHKIYPNVKDKKIFYRLKARLLHEINISLVQFYSFDTGGYDIHSEICLSKLFLSKNNLELAHYHLTKAEKKALAINDLSLLDVIYSEKINLSVQFGETSPEVYVKKRDENQKKVKEIRLLDDALASVIYELRRNQTFSNPTQKIYELLNKAITEVRNRKRIINNVVFETKLFDAISRQLLSQKNYIAIEQYALETYNEFKKKKYFSRSNQDIKLQMLTYLCNALFLNQKNKEALHYVNELHNSMKEYKMLLYDKYVFFYYSSLAYNYMVINPQKAVETLKEAMENKVINMHPTHLGYIYLNLAGVYFDLKEYKTALKNIVKLYNHKLFHSIDDSFKLKIQITEIILRIETQDVDFSLKLLETIHKTHQKLLQDKTYQRDTDFIKLLTVLIKKYHFIKNKQSQQLARVFITNTYPASNLSIIDYTDWLTKKFSLLV